MSCMSVVPEKVSKTASFIAGLLNEGFNSFGFSANRDLYDAFADCKTSWRYNEKKIYEALYTLIYKAYNGRYMITSDVSDTIPGNPLLDFWKSQKRKIDVIENDSVEVVQEWHYEALKTLNFIVYQLSEDMTANDDKTVALNELASLLAMFIATHSPIYHQYNWC